MGRIGITIKAALLGLSLATPAFATSISIQVAETGQTTLTKTFTVSDADIDKIVAAYQTFANVDCSCVATRAQVLNYFALQTASWWIGQVRSLQAQQSLPAPIGVQ